MFSITGLSKPQVEAILKALKSRILPNEEASPLDMLQLEGAIGLVRKIEEETRV